MSMILELCTKERKAIDKLINNIDELVVEDKKTSFHGLDEDGQNNVMALLLLALDDPMEWLTECGDADMIMRSFAKYSLTQKPDDKAYFLSLLRINAIKHFAEHLDGFIQQRAAEHEQDLINETPRYINSLPQPRAPL